jgi:hypothetical protein
MNISPLILFVYNRLDHARSTVDSLLMNPEAKETELYVYSDYARSVQDQQKVSDVRAFLKNISGFKSINIIEREINWGLAKSVIAGVSDILAIHDRVIVLEDDLVVSPNFLSYMNKALNKYEKNKNVISIHGYVYPIKNELPKNFFLKGADCWGWATWKRGWDEFESDGAKLLKSLEDKNLSYSFDFDGSYPYTQMLRDQVAGKNQSWAVRWYASAYLKNRLTLYPGKSLVKNIGLDGSGTHCDSSLDFDVKLSSTIIDFENILVEESLLGREAFITFFKSLKPNLFKRIIRKMKKILKL